MKPDIKKYLHVTQFLQDYYLFRKSEDSRFSFTMWAAEVGIKNKSYLRFLVMGRRPINEKMAAAFSKSLALNKEEHEYFLILIEFSQSKKTEQRKIFGRKLLSLLKSELDQMHILDHQTFLSDTLLPKLLTLLSFTDISSQPKKLSEILAVSNKKLDEAIEKLKALKLVEVKAGILQSLKPSFKVPDAAGSLGLELFYNHVFDEAKNAARLPQTDRRFRSLFVAMNEAERVEFQDSLNEFVQAQLAKYNHEKLENRKLFQIHFHYFPVTKTEEKNLDWIKLADQKG